MRGSCRNNIGSVITSVGLEQEAVFPNRWKSELKTDRVSYAVNTGSFVYFAQNFAVITIFSVVRHQFAACDFDMTHSQILGCYFRARTLR